MTAPTLKHKQVAFEKLLEVYDSLEEIIKILEDDSTINRGNQMPLAEAFITQVSKSVDEIIAHYCGIMKRHEPATQDEIAAIERAAMNVVHEMDVMVHACQQIVVQ